MDDPTVDVSAICDTTRSAGPVTLADIVEFFRVTAATMDEPYELPVEVIGPREAARRGIAVVRPTLDMESRLT